MPLVVVALMALNGCATTGTDTEPSDPMESFNRDVYDFNKGLDTAILKPVAESYQAITPDFIDRAITNFFDNLGDVRNAVNNALQFKLTAAVEDLGRLAVNSTIGLAGFIDLASGFGMERHDEDFGQTLGYWGMDAGPYLVLPFFGPSTVRDAGGLAVDAIFIDPVTQLGHHDTLEYSLLAVRVIDRRADLLGAQDILSAAAWDEYSFVRDSYMQRRTTLVGE